MALAAAPVLAAVVLALAGAPARDGGADAAATGDLDPAMVAHEVRIRLGAVKACYERELVKKPSLSGRVELHWTITLTGNVADPRVEADTLGDPSVAACLTGLVARWRFPPPRGSSVDVTFPFVFQSSGAPPPKHAARPPRPDRTRLVLGNGATLVATLSGVDQQNENQRPRLDLVTTRDDRPSSHHLRVDLKQARYAALSGVIESSRIWTLRSAIADLGKRRAARVGLWGQAGDDLAVVQEITLLVTIEDDPKLLWIGLGGREESQFDTCMVDTDAEFRLAGAGQVERRLRSKMRVSPPAKDDRFEAYRKGCKAPAPRTDVFPLVEN